MTLKRLLLSGAAAVLTIGTAHANYTINGGGSSLAAPTYIAYFQTYTKANPTTLFSYEAVGSGKGQTGFLNNDITQYENVPAGTLTYGTIVGTAVDFGASDAPLTTSQGVTATGGYAESSVDGPIIQIPTIGVAVAFAYNESKQTSTLTLTNTQICGVLSGSITDWHTLNSAIPAGTTIKVAYRSDSSGTTYLLTQHLAAVCPSSPYKFPDLQVTKTFAALFTGGTVPANFTGESGSQNVATYEVATPNSLGYLSPDYTSIAPKSVNTTKLAVASVYNGSTAYPPSVANTELGLANPGAGSTNPTPPNTKALAEDPFNWVPEIPTTTSGYPIVGYTTIDLSSCYANATLGEEFVSFIGTAYSNGTYTTITENNGFAPLTNTKAAPYATAIYDIFLTNESTYGLNVDNATLCAGKAGR